MPMTMGPAARAAPRQRRPPSLAAAATTAAVVACTAALLAASTSSSSSSSSTSSSLSFFAWADALPPTAGDAAAAAETVATAGAIKASTAKAAALPRPGAGCPSYGCPLRPVDVHYDEEARDALAALRKLLERHGDGESEASDGSDGSDGSDASESSIDEALSHLRSSGHDGAATLTLIGYKGGRLEDQINQDRAFVVSPFYLPASTSGNNDEEGRNADSIDGDNPTEEEGEARDDSDENERDGSGGDLLQLLGVFDGHARLGEYVSEHAVSELPRLLSSKLVAIGSSREDSGIEMDNSNDSDSDSSSSSSSSWEDDVKKALIETFIELDQTAPASISGGCTASVVLRYGPDHVFVANSGDSQSFVVTHVPSTGDTRIVYESREDKPHLPDERSRIESMGGKVQMPRREGGTSRVLHVDHTTGQQFGLAMSRSIGDWDAAKVGVVPDPIVDALYLPSIVSDAVAAARGNGSCAVEIDAGGEASVDVNDPACHEGAAANVSEQDVQVFAVSATDGLLDFLSTDLVASHLAKSLYGGGADGGDEDDDDDDESGAGAQRHPLVACDDLVRAAAHGWQEAKGGRYRDDIAIAVSRIDVAPGRR